MDRRTFLGAAALAPVAALVRARPARAAEPEALVLVAAGDLNQLPHARQTGALAVAQQPDCVALLGDQQYPAGSLADYRTHFASTPWAQLRSVTHPVPGHHEWDTAGAAGYFAYFGVEPWYAYAIGPGWRGYALDSHGKITEQARWLTQDLAAHPGVGVVASWSDPRWSSGTKHGSSAAMQPLVAALAGRSGVVLNGHEHHYERFAPDGRMRQFVVGTGGNATYPFGPPVRGSQVRISHVPGVLVLRLGADGAYSWAFKDASGSVRDRG